ncbi:MAG: copper transporter [Acidimicrobiia bacterium]|nr:copper transporter [Acidimicrobiia bacterium]
MLNLRYHVVSLVAVFLALGIGVIMGATVIDRVTVDQLRNRLDGVEASDRNTRSENDRLATQLRTWDKFADQGRAELLAGQLRGVPVLLVGVDGIDRKSVSDLRAQLMTAGANVEGTLWLTDKLNLRSQADVNTLANAVGVADDTPDVVRATALAKLADALRSGSDQNAVVAALHQGGFIDYEAPPAPTSTSSSTTPFGPDTIPVRGTRSVIISGAGARLNDDTMTMPFVTQLALNDAPVIAAEAGQDTPGGRDVFVGLILRRPETAARISTIDNLESFIGQAAAVLALRDAGQQPAAHYGVGAGADRLLPEPPPTPTQ